MKKLICAALILLALTLCGAAAADLELYGVTFSENAEVVDFGDTKILDFEALFAVLDRMPRLRQVNMFANQMKEADCERLASRYPNVRWGWTLVIAGKDHRHLVRTDTQTFSTLHNNQTSHHRSEDFEILKYVWDLKALDVGHNSVTSLDFLYNLPDLRILIIACNEVTDITPMASLHRLEYAEIFKNRITDLTPLQGLDHLLDLNICFNSITDVTPILGLKQLTRLWCYRCSWYKTWGEIPKATANLLKESLPDTQVDSVHYSTAGTWRYLNSQQTKLHPHYEVITKNFGADSRHPGDGTYYPFAESWPEEPEPEAPAEETTEAGPEAVTVIPVPLEEPEEPAATEEAVPDKPKHQIHTDGMSIGGK